MSKAQHTVGALSEARAPSALTPNLARLDRLDPALAYAVLASAAPAPAVNIALGECCGADVERISAEAGRVGYASSGALTEAGAAAVAAFAPRARTLDAALSMLAAAVVGVSPHDKPRFAALMRQDRLAAAALAKLLGLTTGPAPTRLQVRFEMARAALIERAPDWGPALKAVAPRSGPANPLLSALTLASLGAERKTLMEAETHMLQNALGVKTASKSDVARGLVRAAVGGNPRAPEAKPATPADFAAVVRRLSRTMETKPYAGRVAIAQVYDAGVALGHAFGTLEEFKARVAQACRDGLLDLERYDIAGPMDAALRERSRTPFGRDERHFIVNQYI
ncbi:MAG: hypothetical protein NW215_13335 [Hyphomicrobiales bacterium]|nr:hypothetical protein [Hyphomicrobiales bacterium]